MPKHKTLTQAEARDLIMEAHLSMPKEAFEEYWRDASNGGVLLYDRLMGKIERLKDNKQAKKDRMKLKGDRQFETQMNKPGVERLSGLPTEWRDQIVPKLRKDKRTKNCVKWLDNYMDTLVECGKFHPSDHNAFNKTMRVVVKPFWENVIKMYKKVLASPRARKQVRTLLADLSALYVSTYDGIFKQEVQEGDPDGFAEFNAEVSHQLERTVHYGVCQSSTDIQLMYCHALAAKKAYNRQCEEIAQTTHGEFTPAPLKHVFRAIEKTAMRPNKQERFRCTNVYDVVRGALVYDTMEGVARGLREVCKEFDVMRIKNRFFKVGQATQSGGWRDVVVNMCLTNDFNRHVLEVQIQLRCLVNVRSELGGHFIYAKYRALTEALEVCNHGTSHTTRHVREVLPLLSRHPVSK